MSPHIPTPCPHERRPGTTVCLSCLRESRAAAAARRRRVLLKGGGVLLGAALVAGSGIAGVSAIRGSTAPSTAATPATEHAAVGQPADSPPVVLQAGVPTLTPAPSAPAPPTPPLTPVVALGRTELPRGAFAVRTESGVEVHFDTPEARTRRRDKFERVLRATLPLIYGRKADSLLAAIPVGGIVGGGDLVDDLTTRGIQLPLAGGWSLGLWPETRPGQDGPLVVTYRATLSRRG